MLAQIWETPIPADYPPISANKGKSEKAAVEFVTNVHHLNPPFL